MASESVFALFCLADLSVETVNRILEESRSSDGEFSLWLASNDWTSSLSDPDQGTIPPIESVPRDYIGKDAADVARVLVDLPDEKGFNREFFAILDEKSGTDGDLMLCCIFQEEIADDPDGDIPVGELERAEGEIEGFRAPAEGSGTYLGAMSVCHPPWENTSEGKIVLKRPGKGGKSGYVVTHD